MGRELVPEPPIKTKQVDARFYRVYEDDIFETDLMKSWIIGASKIPGEKLF
jgi:predicted ribonuclease toxin of YeeF-YezG toxin-antitoxin module